MPISHDAVVHAYRLLLRRDPESPEVVAAQAARFDDLDAIRRELMSSHEFRSTCAETAVRQPYGIPRFLLDDPHVEAAMLRLEPTLADLGSQLCTGRQFSEPEFRICSEALTIDPSTLHRKNWEWVYILQALKQTGLVRAGACGLGFGTGREPLVSLLAAHGVDVVATDAPPDIGAAWSEHAQFSRQLQDLHKPNIVDSDRFYEHVRFEVVDMRALPSHLRGFDFLWSSCALEHLGSLQAGIDFIQTAMDCLRPGGIAVHTTEFNLGSNDQTIESDWISVYRRQDIDGLFASLASRGHHAFPINYFPGGTERDQHIDYPPYGLPHLKVRFGDVTMTSLGLLLRRAG